MLDLATNKTTAEDCRPQARYPGKSKPISCRRKESHCQETHSGGRIVAMAGDGVTNGRPGLAESAVGIAMGTGNEVAIQSAGITW